MSRAATDEVLTPTEGPLARIRLNRPEAIHSLTTAMCQAVLDALEQWRGDDAVRAVLIDHAAGRGFCAGGDIRMLADSGAGDGTDARAFFATEYRMNERLFTYAKPTVVLMDGITMGGGAGLALPCRYRVATENTRLAMPETGIGLFPDVGAGWYLSRLPGRVGQYLALTGYRLNGAEAHTLGLATHYVAAGRLDAVKERLAERPAEVAAILDEASGVPGDAPLPERRLEIDRLFASDRLEEVFAALEADPSPGRPSSWRPCAPSRPRP